MSQDFLGIGWSFPVTLRRRTGDDNTGTIDLAMSYYEQSIRESIWIILSTARGERVMRPDFGCGIHSLVFALENASTIGRVQHEVEQALLFWEPRINVLNVSIRSETRKSSRVRRSPADGQPPGNIDETIAVGGGTHAGQPVAVEEAEPYNEVRGEDAFLLIDIEYSVKATNSRFNIVYPFYLERAQLL
jgi:phage baseplate assembly protein W